MHILMMSLYAGMTALVLAAIETKSANMRERVIHGLKTFLWFMGVGMLLSWIFFPIPW
jgi:hypothetical protein